MPLISVILPTRNRPDYLREALESISAQTRQADEVIVVDDGLSGNTNKVAASVDQSIRVVDNAERGPVPARNLGVRSARSDVIVFLDDDDVFIDRDYLLKVEAFFKNGGQFCFCDGRIVFDSGRPSIDFAMTADSKTLEVDNSILISGVAFQRRLHQELGGFDEVLPYYWDWDWYLRVARSGVALHRITGPAVAIRVHDRNMSGAAFEADRRANLDRFAAKHGIGPLTLKNHLSLAEEGNGKAS
jgi:glycosyltransferase involved in cell wall biosynthesis